MTAPADRGGPQAPEAPEGHTGHRRARRGRPPGTSNTRADVLDAARRVFAARGYNDASLRAIATEAGVDPGMVRHFFGNKAGLFQATVEFPVNLDETIPQLLAGGLDGVGERLIRLLLSVWDAAPDRNPLLTLVRSAVSHEESARVIREFITEQLLARLAAAVDRPDPHLRATLVASQIIGLIMARYVVHVEPLVSADAETVVAAVGPTIQRYLTGDLT